MLRFTRLFALTAVATAALTLPLGVVFATEPTAYEDIQLRGSVLSDQINQVRSPNVAKKYFLYRIANDRSYERALERDATGSSEFPHDLNPVVEALEDNNVCYNWVGEVLGFSNQLRTSPPAATADDMVDSWEASPSHNDLIKDPSADWGGGGWVLSDSGTYFYAYYVVDVCGV